MHENNCYDTTAGIMTLALSLMCVLSMYMCISMCCIIPGDHTCCKTFWSVDLLQLQMKNSFFFVSVAENSSSFATGEGL